MFITGGMNAGGVKAMWSSCGDPPNGQPRSVRVDAVVALAAVWHRNEARHQQAMTGDHETRLRAPERFKYLLLGGCLLGGSLSGAATTLIVFALSKHRRT
jgi:hypothetical protein